MGELIEASLECGLPFVALAHYGPDPAVLDVVPHELARRLALLPLFRLEGRLFVAVANPGDLEAQDYLREVTGSPIEPVLASREELEDAFNRLFIHQEQAVTGQFGDEGLLSVERLAAPAAPLENEETPVIKLVNHLISHGVHLGASDIHLEPFTDAIELRYRVDGILHTVTPPPTALYRSIVSRIKIVSGLDISEHRLPQDGRMTYNVDGRDYDLRVSVIPDVFGECVVIRILDRTARIHDLTSLGMEPDTLDRLERLISLPFGILLVTGPTGSGKSTTLYSVLNRIYTPRRKIITLEDPVEAHIARVMQIQIHPEIGYTYAQGLRAILRHDPDVVMVGEIRDLESAEIALRASLTGHLLFSTLHTNDAPLAVTRLIDMGIPPFLVLSSLIGVLAQRLVRKLCVECRYEREPTPSELDQMRIKALLPGQRFFVAQGCSACSHLGYRGRTGIFELLEIAPDMRHLRGDDLGPEQLVRRARNFRSLRESALLKLFDGTTSLEEVISVAGAVPARDGGRANPRQERKEAMT
jgi:type II secretory ATPase GspE/PulE/Tfp pilus assembly ATPase PilB-like protein